jgi:molecular chaperone HscB
LPTTAASSRAEELGPDYFACLGLPRKLNLATDALDRRFRALSREWHPDYFHNAAPDERRAALARSSYLNDAYRALRDPMTRAAYLLELEGVAAKNPREASRQVPPALLEDVFALNEELDEVRALRRSGAPEAEWRARLERARAPIEARRAEHETSMAALAARWDALVDADAPADERRRVLEELRDRVLERNYIANLIAGIERELA